MNNLAIDTSDFYRLMCEKAELLQSNWKPVLGDYVAYYLTGRKIRNFEGICRYGYDDEIKIFDKRDCVWLPTQHQLVKMLTPKQATYSFTYISYTAIERGRSWEQHWLRQVMYHVYEQKWIRQLSDWRDI